MEDVWHCSWDGYNAIWRKIYRVRVFFWGLRVHNSDGVAKSGNVGQVKGGPTQIQVRFEEENYGNLPKTHSREIFRKYL